MEAGTVAKWAVEVGSTFSAGDVLAEIETDKASIDFVTEDDGVVAKILVGDGATDVKVRDGQGRRARRRARRMAGRRAEPYLTRFQHTFLSLPLSIPGR